MAERLKFRCYNCNQLLAVAETKAGSVVACPKCRADLLIPGRDSAPSPVPTEWASGDGETPGIDQPSVAPAPSREGPILGDFAEIASILPVELANLRPEDVRVESEFFENLTRPREPEPPVEPPTEPPIDFTAITGAVTQPVIDAGPTTDFEPPVEAPSRPTAPIPAGIPAPLPAIEVEPPVILPKVPRSQAIREVVVPASVVLAWSLFGLVGLFVSFLAGLLVGHFMWKQP